ncbi:hypothetical protein QW180_15360 [Vibrio sinaloensis]|nr:hypothetical protein [Vibrio sinaloensis]
MSSMKKNNQPCDLPAKKKRHSARWSIRWRSKRKEAPYFISHHSHFINAMLKFNVVDNSNIELLKEQFAVSVAIVIANLVKQDPMHPKVSKIQQAKRIVQERLQKRATA